jgi:hypothetical protein
MPDKLGLNWTSFSDGYGWERPKAMLAEVNRGKTV